MDGKVFNTISAHEAGDKEVTSAAQKIFTASPTPTS